MGYGRRKYSHQCVGKQKTSKLKEKIFRCPGNSEVFKETIPGMHCLHGNSGTSHNRTAFKKVALVLLTKLSLSYLLKFLLFLIEGKLLIYMMRGTMHWTMHLFLYCFPLNILFISQLRSYFIYSFHYDPLRHSVHFPIFSPPDLVQTMVTICC